MRADDSLPERFRSPRKTASDVRCTACQALLAKLVNDTIDIQRNDMQVAFAGNGQASIVCYRPHCRKLNVVTVTTKVIAPNPNN